MSCHQTGLVCVFLWLLLLHLAPAKGQSGIPPRAVLVLHPQRSTVFNGESMSLTCMDSLSSVQGPITWYNGEDVWETTSEKITIRKSGDYQCKTRRSSFSEPVHVEFSSDEVILQVLPHPIFEGDDVFLKCQRKSGELNKSTYFKDGKELKKSGNSDIIKLRSVSRDSSQYSCKAFWKTAMILARQETSKPLKIQVQELFLPPVLTSSPSQPIEGAPATLKCETRLPPQRSHVQLRFCFFKDGQPLGSGCNSSWEIQIPTMWMEDSGSYWCQAEAAKYNIIKRSPSFQMHVQRIPVSDVNLETWPPGGQLIEGENLVLICSVAKGTGPITFSWHKDGTSVGKKTQQSLSAELLILTVKIHDAGKYYCAADNGGPVLSNRIRVTVRSPVSHPVLILRTSRDQAIVGDLVELHCEAPTGSPPIWYQFYHEDVTLGNSSAPNGGGTSFNFSLTKEHSGNYSCEADNGLGPKRSHRVSLKVIGPRGSKAGLIPAGVIGGLLGVLGLAAAAVLLHHFRARGKSGRSAPETPSPSDRQEPSFFSLSSSDPQEHLHAGHPALMEQQPIYTNVNPGGSDVEYSQIQHMQPRKGNSANSPRMCQKDKEPVAIYSELRMVHCDDSAWQASRNQEDDTENYENVSRESAVLGH
ncbi:Fc receptor-like protein 3 isoform X7 [Perognathus longimembris pacificus]|uniref:Fc receptor-like protein 3 isoform X7 n=1 Tax=Perognathus longimembris pacificus TaxID=214514 RepID=UPI0020189C2B|nr:Fc receptor-like protein 3 isoform X7 [Perognathus longimembris pacificus]